MPETEPGQQSPTVRSEQLPAGGQQDQSEAGVREPRQDREGPVEHVVERGTRLSSQFVATMISLASAAFGVVAALAWNSAITKTFETYLNSRGEISALYIYASVVTVIGVLVIVLLGRIAARIDAEPVEFKYPTAPART